SNLAEAKLDQAHEDWNMAGEMENALLRHVSPAEIPTGESCLDNPETIRALHTMAHTSQPIGTVNLGAYMDAEQLAGSLGRSGMMAAAGPITVPADQRAQAPYGIVRQLYRPTHLLDFIPT